MVESGRSSRSSTTKRSDSRHSVHTWRRRSASATFASDSSSRPAEVRQRVAEHLRQRDDRQSSERGELSHVVRAHLLRERCSPAKPAAASRYALRRSTTSGNESGDMRRIVWWSTSRAAARSSCTKAATSAESIPAFRDHRVVATLEPARAHLSSGTAAPSRIRPRAMTAPSSPSTEFVIVRLVATFGRMSL